MAITHGMPLLYPVVVGDELMIRALRDYDEMPTLQLTTAQAMRLWNLDRPTCQKLLETLVEARLLRIDAAGRYTRPADQRSLGDPGAQPQLHHLLADLERH